MMAAIIALALIAIVLAYIAHDANKTMALYRIAFKVVLRILTDNGIEPDNDMIEAAHDALREDSREERT